MLEGLKVVSPQEMRRIEALACAEGASEQEFMEKAAQAIADSTSAFIQNRVLPKVVTLLVGKGNNGGDAFAAGVELIKRGFKVDALHLYSMDHCSPLCAQMGERFLSLGGKRQQVGSSSSLHLRGVILDGLVGTGFKGKAEGLLAAVIEKANGSGHPILAIDIPSGLNGSTGEVESVAITASETIFLELPKIGFFLKNGWDHVGALKLASFDLGLKYREAARPLAYLLNEQALSLPLIQRSRHKYQAGYVLSFAGSIEMPGAAFLSGYAALRTGAGIVRLFHRQPKESEVSGAPVELIRQVWDRKKSSLQREAQRAKAAIVGPGMGRTKELEKYLKRIFQWIDLPCVIDGDALFFLAKHFEWNVPKGSVLTPHRGEMDKLLHFRKKGEGSSHYLELCQNYVEEKKVTLLLKGAPTYLLAPQKLPLIIARGDPGMATAGSGDVLTGMIAALLAQGLDAKTASALAAYLHGLSGEIAASQLTSYCVTASDLIDFLPKSFRHLHSVSHFYEHAE